MAGLHRYRVNSFGGVLTWVPEQLTEHRERPPQLFRPHTLAGSTIRICALGDHADLNSPQSATTKTSNLYITVKLAFSRENAKRFLRSVIAQHSAQQDQISNRNPDPAEAGKAASKRRSWSPVKRTQSGEATDRESTDNMRGGLRASIGGPVAIHRPSLVSTTREHPSSVSTQSYGDHNGANTNGGVPMMDLDNEKPVASGNGISMGINLTEPVLFLQGFEQTDDGPTNTAMLRGSLHLRVQKSAKIKAISLKFRGKAITRWPEGIPPRKIDFDETDTIMSHTWPFFNAQFENAEKGTSADHIELFKGPTGSQTTVTRINADPLGRSSPNGSAVNLSTKEARKLSLQVNQSRSFGKGDSATGGSSVASKGYRTFYPGDYVYNFELPLDSRLPETIDAELGSVKYELQAVVERSGAFRANLVGSKEVTLIRAPAEGSLEQVEPIAISRNWEDQLHYDIVISGKSFPLGSQVPIAFKLTPLAKVECHRIKVMITENIEYFCSNKRVHRMEPTRKVQLFEKRADGPPTSTFPGSTMRVTAGGGIPYDARARAARGEDVVPLDTTNLLGNLEGDTNIGPTEMEFNVQLPSCHAMKERERSQKLHFDTTYSNIQVHHWIKIVMRLSKPDTVDPAKRRHFEISIDSPFHILSCRATQANTSLPAYSSPDQANSAHLYECGCPGAARRRNSHTSSVPIVSSLNTSFNSSDVNLDRPVPDFASLGLARPQQAHIYGTTPNANAHLQPQQHQPSRPIHLLRAPSFNPPAFEDEEAPPPLATPPPQYDSIASPTSGLADYFTRLSDAYDEDSGDESHPGRFGRVDIPLTPGSRVNRSMDVSRAWLPIGSRT